MKWIRFTIDTHVSAVDTLSYMLSEIGVEGIEVEDHLPLSEEDKQKMYVDILPDPVEEDSSALVHFYMEPESCDPEKVMLDVQHILSEIKEFCEIGKATVSLSETEDKDWINNWKTFFKPFHATEHIVIKPTWEDYTPENKSELLIEIDPGIAFGTGSHETTKLCIRELEKYVKKGDSVLDIGCGSGILSITALKLGAKKATAIDIDEAAVRTAAENLTTNHLPENLCTLLEGDFISNSVLRDTAGKNHSIVVANILADIIIPLTSVIRPHICPGGLYITSGILDTKKTDVQNALLENGFEIIRIEHMKDWCCFIAKA